MTLKECHEKAGTLPFAITYGSNQTKYNVIAVSPDGSEYTAKRTKTSTAFSVAADVTRCTLINENSVAAAKASTDLQGTYQGDFMTVVFDAGEAAKCECGAEAVGAPGHSHWCPKFTGDK